MESARVELGTERAAEGQAQEHRGGRGQKAELSLQGWAGSRPGSSRGRTADPGRGHRLCKGWEKERGPCPHLRGNWDNGSERSWCPKGKGLAPRSLLLTLVILCQLGSWGPWKPPGTRASVTFHPRWCVNERPCPSLWCWGGPHKEHVHGTPLLSYLTLS